MERFPSGYKNFNVGKKALIHKITMDYCLNLEK